ncbi:MAG: hypothetical protein HQ523_14460 [Lentisphaerae bacterium]|nr:hypothetical protein [Lentisphaerota bacterium]
MKSLAIVAMAMGLALGAVGCKTAGSCCGDKAMAPKMEKMDCAKCGMSKDKCKCTAEAVCTKCNMPKSKCKCM